MQKKQNKKMNLSFFSNKTILEEINGQIEEKQIQTRDIQNMEDATEDEKRAMLEKINKDIEILTRSRESIVQKENEKRSFNPLSTYETRGNKKEEATEEIEEDIYGTFEYRKAFKNYVQKGVKIPQEFKRDAAGAMTTTDDTKAIIPTNIMNRVIKERNVKRTLFDRVTKTNYPAGVNIPIAEINSEAEWIDEGTSGKDNKVDISKYINFMYYTLEKKIRKTLVASVVSLEMFEDIVVEMLINAMYKALETAILKGTGVGQPTGIINTKVDAKNQTKMNQEEINTLKAWLAIEAKIPLENEEDEGTVYLMHKSTWETYLNGAVDEMGQRLGVTRIEEKLKRILNGREVLPVSGLPSFENAKEGEVFAVAVTLPEYCLNTNMQMLYKKYTDETNNTIVDKGIMIADGKMMDSSGLILIKKA